MSGCFDNSAEDRYREKQLHDFLNEEEEEEEEEEDFYDELFEDHIQNENYLKSLGPEP